MFYEIKIGTEPYQNIDFDFFESRIRLEIFFNPLASRWFCNVLEPRTSKILIKGMPLVTGVNLLDRVGSPYFFRVVDKSSNGLDPMFQDDWAHRCGLFIALKSEEL